jgi:hypothetical protein
MIGTLVTANKRGTHDGDVGTVVRIQDNDRWPLVVQWSDGTQTGYSPSEVSVIPSRSPQQVTLLSQDND